MKKTKDILMGIKEEELSKEVNGLSVELDRFSTTVTKSDIKTNKNGKEKRKC